MTEQREAAEMVIGMATDQMLGICHTLMSAHIQASVFQMMCPLKDHSGLETLVDALEETLLTARELTEAIRHMDRHTIPVRPVNTN